jgi:phenylalanyl-tRNA synthetase alpha chain
MGTPGSREIPDLTTVLVPGDHEVTALASIDAAPDLEALAALEEQLLGRRSLLREAHGRLGQLQVAERREAGRRLGELREQLAGAIERRRAELSPRARAALLEAERLDLSEVRSGPSPGHLHAVTRVTEELEDIFLGMGYEIAEGPEIETDWYNFEALNMGPDHPARSSYDTFYLDVGDGHTELLRTHTSPVQVHLLERGRLPIYAVVPGLCHRRDTPDPSHLASFHQIEALVVDEGVSFADLAGTIDLFVKALLGPDTASRLRPGYFPFTEPSAELDVSCLVCDAKGCRTCSGTGWLELGGAGMVHPAVLTAASVDPERWSGFAFGFGIDRLALMRHEVGDVRWFLENDVRLARQIP